MITVEIENLDVLAASVLFQLESKSNMASHANSSIMLSLVPRDVHRKCYLFLVLLLTLMVPCLQSAECYVVHSSFITEPTPMISHS